MFRLITKTQTQYHYPALSVSVDFGLGSQVFGQYRHIKYWQKVIIRHPYALKSHNFQWRSFKVNITFFTIIWFSVTKQTEWSLEDALFEKYQLLPILQPSISVVQAAFFEISLLYPLVSIANLFWNSNAFAALALIYYPGLKVQ